MVWLAGMPGARETRLTPSKETCRLKQQGNLPTEIEIIYLTLKPISAEAVINNRHF
jgi:hypothetical protein